MLRFQISFPEDWPDRAPVITFLQDVFHPLVTPLTTYTYSARDRGTDTFSAADQEKLPPGGLVLREGFPEWFEDVAPTMQAQDGGVNSEEQAESQGESSQIPHIVEVLHYLSLAFTVPDILDDVPLASAANPSAWHAWRSYRAKVLGERARSPTIKSPRAGSVSDASEGSLSPRSRQQPGGARRPGEWNWTGVWEERVRKVVHTSRAEIALFGGEGAGVVSCCNSSRKHQRCPSLPRLTEARAALELFCTQHIRLTCTKQIDFAKVDEEALASIIQQIETQADS